MEEVEEEDIIYPKTDGKPLELDDLVWAKMRGYPYWPGRISFPEDGKIKIFRKPFHFVKFFGTHDYAWISEDFIVHHSLLMLQQSRMYKKIRKAMHVAINEIKIENMQLQKFIKVEIKEEPMESTATMIKTPKARDKIKSKKRSSSAMSSGHADIDTDSPVVKKPRLMQIKDEPILQDKFPGKKGSKKHSNVEINILPLQSASASTILKTPKNLSSKKKSFTSNDAEPQVIKKRKMIQIKDEPKSNVEIKIDPSEPTCTKYTKYGKASTSHQVKDKPKSNVEIKIDPSEPTCTKYTKYDKASTSHQVKDKPKSSVEIKIDPSEPTCTKYMKYDKASTSHLVKEEPKSNVEIKIDPSEPTYTKYTKCDKASTSQKLSPKEEAKKKKEPSHTHKDEGHPVLKKRWLMQIKNEQVDEAMLQDKPLEKLTNVEINIDPSEPSCSKYANCDEASNISKTSKKLSSKKEGKKKNPTTQAFLNDSLSQNQNSKLKMITKVQVKPSFDVDSKIESSEPSCSKRTECEDISTTSKASKKLSSKKKDKEKKNPESPLKDSTSQVKKSKLRKVPRLKVRRPFLRANFVELGSPPKHSISEEDVNRLGRNRKDFEKQSPEAEKIEENSSLISQFHFQDEHDSIDFVCPYETFDPSGPSTSGSIPKFCISSEDTSNLSRDDHNDPTSSLKRKKIGFLGIGRIGCIIVKHLLEGGYNVLIWNRIMYSSIYKLRDCGAEVAKCPAHVIAVCDITFSCLATPDVSKHVVFGLHGVFEGFHTLGNKTHGKAYVEMSSIDHTTSEEICEALESFGVKYLEAPMIGTLQQVREKSMLILAAGNQEIYDEVQPIFAFLAKSIMYVSPLVGKANILNQLVSMVRGTTLAALGETIELAKTCEIQPEIFLDGFKKVPFACDLISNAAISMIHNSGPIEFPVKHQSKELDMALQLSNEHNQPLFLTAATSQSFVRAARLYPENDASAIHKIYQFNP